MRLIDLLQCSIQEMLYRWLAREPICYPLFSLMDITHRGSNFSIHLCAIPFNPVSKRPVLPFQFLVCAHLHVSLPRHNRQTVPIHTPRIAIKEDFHALAHRGNGLLPGQILYGVLIRHEFAENWLRQVRTKARREGRRSELCAQQVDRSQERLVVRI